MSKNNTEKPLSRKEKRRMIYEIQTLGKKLLAMNGGKDIPLINEAMLKDKQDKLIDLLQDSAYELFN